MESLSTKFKALGQEKTVEELSQKDDDTINEFEKLVDAALDKVSETTEMPSVTKATKAEEEVKEEKKEEEKPSEDVVEQKPAENLTKQQFFKGVCNELSREQTKHKPSRARFM